MDTPRKCHELYGAARESTYAAIMQKAKVCQRPARYRIIIGGFGALYRCGVHVNGYRLADNRIERVEP